MGKIGADAPILSLLRKEPWRAAKFDRRDTSPAPPLSNAVNTFFRRCNSTVNSAT